MEGFQYWVVVAEDETYHQTPDNAENLHRIGLPIVAGPFNDGENASMEARGGGLTVVTLPEGVVPNDWDE